MALLEKEPSDLGEDNDYLDKIQKDLYYASSHERADFTLSSLATSLYSVVHVDPPNQDCISSADAYKWEK